MVTDHMLEKALTFDPLATAEIVTGESYKENERVTGLGFALMQENRISKEAALRERGDTTFSMTTEDYAKVLRDEGFKCVAQFDFDGRPYSGEPTPREFRRIEFKPSEGLLLAWDTHHGQRNSANVYFNLRFEDQQDGSHFRLPGFSGGLAKRDEKIAVGSIDAREGLRFWLQRFRAVGDFVTPWVESWLISMALLHYMDYDAHRGHENREALRAIETQRAESLPAEVRAVIGI